MKRLVLWVALCVAFITLYSWSLQQQAEFNIQFMLAGFALASGLSALTAWMGMIGRDRFRQLFLVLASVAGLVAVYGWAAIAVEFSFRELWEKSDNLVALFARMWPPDWSFLPQIWKPLLDTFRMAILGTVIGALLSLPLTLLSTRMVVRTPWIYYPVRFLMGAIRSIPDLLYALLFVAAFGIGPVAGTPALAIFSAAILAKMTSESADNIDRGPIEALEATGAGRLSVIFFAVLPQIIPIFLSYTFYVFEINIRAATVLAYVGAGGIGQSLQIALEWWNFNQVTTVLVVIFVIVFAIDLISSYFRDALVEGRDIKWWSKAAMLVAVLGGTIWAATSIDIDPARISRGMVRLGHIIQAIFSPDWSVTLIGIEKMIESIQIALVGTTVALMLAFPFGFLCARNMGLPGWMSFMFRQIPNIIRTFPEIILAIFFIAAYGPGAFPGVLALGIHSIGMISRLNYEIVETIDRGPVEALNATGATRITGFRFAVLPQVIPEFLAVGLYRFEINVRAATTLGIVGAGGIGTVIINATRLGRYNELGTFLFVVIVFVSLIDFTSAWARRRLIEG